MVSTLPAFVQRRHPLDGGRFFVVKRCDFTAHLDADQQADTTNLVDYVRVLFLNSGQSFHEERPILRCILCKRVAVDDLEDFVRYGRSQIAAEEQPQVPGPSTSTCSSEIQTAPIGKPPPSDLAMPSIGVRQIPS